MGRYFGAVAAVFVIFGLLDFVFHGLILGAYYEATQALWRPMDQSPFWIRNVTVLLVALLFCGGYSLLTRRDGWRTGLLYGLILGGIEGLGNASMYVFQPVPEFMAVIWLLSGPVQGMAAGLAVGLIIKGGKEETAG